MIFESLIREITYEWQNNTTPFSTEGVVVVTPNVTAEYHCDAHGFIGKRERRRASGTVNVIIREPPMITTSQPSTISDNGIEVMIGTDTCINDTFMGMVNFTCVVVSGRLPVMISWQVGGEDFMNDNHSMVISVNDTASILVVGVDTGASVDQDLNNYSCMAINIDGNDTDVSVLSRCDCSLICENGGTPTSDCSACDCVPGYEGLNCSVNTDDCSPNPCQHLGNCTDDINSYDCTCAEGYTGADCENDVNDCVPNPCQNGGNCNNTGVSSYDCICVAGYSGTNCEIDIDECSSNPCQNGATCKEGINAYNCTCVAGYNGTDCEIDIDECSSNPCQNGATCNEGINAYNCTCAEGYNGTNCENDIDKCSSNPCQNEGSCTNVINSYTCDCVLGYTGSNCETDINDCDSDPCQNGGNCTDEINGYSCTCVAGYLGIDCENDIDQCSPNPCKNWGRCTNLQNDYNCTCDPVYSSRNCSGCAIPNCEQCRESSQNAIGECMKCVGVFVLDNGTCNDNCGIPNCILCDRVDMTCIQCQEGYRENNGECSEEMAEEEDADSDGLSARAFFGIVLACILGLLVLIIIIVAMVFGLHRQRTFSTTDGRPHKVINPMYQKQTSEVNMGDDDTKATEL